jgi:flagellar basal-body rod modification protein FlgD
MADPISTTTPPNTGLQFGKIGSSNENVKQSQMDKDTFLKLLSAQLRYQDPMNPVDNSQFLAQTAQFTSLEQMTNLANATKENLFGTQMNQGVQMIGKTVTYQPPADLDGVLPPSATGTVDAVVVEDNKVLLKIGANRVPVTQVSEVK